MREKGQKENEEEEEAYEAKNEEARDGLAYHSS